MNTEIWVEINGVKKILDTFENEVISFNFNLSDITEVNTRSSSYSKSIRLPDTKNNRAAFEYISELTSDSLFNPNLKSPCFVYSDGLEIFRGNLQLRNISVDFITNKNTYDVVIFNEIDTIFRNIGEKYLSDLDFSFLDHTWDFTNISLSWTADWTNGYFYPVIDNGRNYTTQKLGQFLPATFNVDPTTGLYVNEMFPAVYAKTILDRIFLEAGFTYKSDFFNSDFFKDIIIPWNGQKASVQSDDIYNNLFRAEFVTSPTYSFLASNQGTYRLNFANVLQNDNGVYQASPTYSYVQPVLNFSQQFASEVIINFLVGASMSGTYSATASNSTLSGTINTQLFDTDISFKFRRDQTTGADSNIPIDGGPFFLNNGSYVGTPICRVRWTGTFPLVPQFVNARGGSSTEFFQVGDKIYASFSCFVFSDLLDGRADPDIGKYAILQSGEKVDALLTYRYNSTPILPLFPSTGGEISVSKETSFYNIISSTLYPGGIFNMNAWAPRKFKQKDFIKGLINMFNLFMIPDKNNSRILKIEPREDFYKDGETLDWNDKIDLKSIDVSFLSDYQSKQILLSYKEDRDYTNEQYKLQTQEVYGQEIFQFENDFIKDENKIITSFSPTPIVAIPSGQGFSDVPISRIAKDENGGIYESNLRIMFKNYIPMQDLQKQFWVLWGSTTTNPSPYIMTSFPYAGHLDNPLSPTFDLNFGQVFTSSYEWTPTRNTLTNRYWQNYIDLINNRKSRLFVAEFYLDPVDISNFNFKNKIYLELNGQPCLFIVNKIVDYNPIVKSLTKVELIKIN